MIAKHAAVMALSTARYAMAVVATATVPIVAMIPHRALIQSSARTVLEVAGQMETPVKPVGDRAGFVRPAIITQGGLNVRLVTARVLQTAKNVTAGAATTIVPIVTVIPIGAQIQ